MVYNTQSYNSYSHKFPESTNGRSVALPSNRMRNSRRNTTQAHGEHGFHSPVKQDDQFQYGHIATFTPAKFGFIKPDGYSKDIFFSAAIIPRNFYVKQYDRVRFRRTVDEHGRAEAQDVVLLKYAQQPQSRPLAKPIIPLRKLIPKTPPQPKLIPKRSRVGVQQLSPQSEGPKTTTKTVPPPVMLPLAEEESFKMDSKGPIKLPDSSVKDFDWTSIVGDSPRSNIPPQYSFPPEEDEITPPSSPTTSTTAELNTRNFVIDEVKEDADTTADISGENTPQSPVVDDIRNLRIETDFGDQKVEYDDGYGYTPQQYTPQQEQSPVVTKNGLIKERIPCRYYGSARGCSKGDGCLYAHDNPTAIRLCESYFSDEGCEYGDSCRFRHRKYPEFDSDPKNSRRRRRRVIETTNGPSHGSFKKLRQERQQQQQEQSKVFNDGFKTPAAAEIGLGSNKLDKISLSSRHEGEEKQENFTSQKPQEHKKQPSLAFSFPMEEEDEKDHPLPPSTHSEGVVKEVSRSFNISQQELQRLAFDSTAKSARSWRPESLSPPPMRHGIKKFDIQRWYSSEASTSRY